MSYEVDNGQIIVPLGLNANQITLEEANAVNEKAREERRARK